MKFSAHPFLLFLIASAAVAVNAQPGRFPDPMRDETPPKAVRDKLEKMRIEETKKDYAELLKRGEDAAKIAADLEDQVATRGSLTESDLGKLDEVEKLVKKIRNDLGAKEGDEADDEDEHAPSSARDAVGALRRAAVSLYDELKKASRFTISAAAIRTSNAILRVARFLKVPTR